MSKDKYSHLVSEWIELYQEKNYSTAKIASKFGCSAETVRKRLKSNNIEMNKMQITHI